jgi:hypothetical protein
MTHRRRGHIKTKPTFAVVVDGDCEVWYLQMLKRNERSINVNIEPKIPQKKKLSEQFENVKSLSKDYKKVFWIIDFDTILSEARNARNGERTRLQEFEAYHTEVNDEHDNIVIIINNPCLEYWLLLHFEATAKVFTNCVEAQKQLKKHLTDYEKTQKYYTKENDIYKKLRPKLKTAIKNSIALGSFDITNPNKALAEMSLFFHDDEFGEHFKS